VLVARGNGQALFVTYGEEGAHRGGRAVEATGRNSYAGKTEVAENFHNSVSAFPLGELSHSRVVLSGGLSALG